jgi:hypothetical protein
VLVLPRQDLVLRAASRAAVGVQPIPPVEPQGPRRVAAATEPREGQTVQAARQQLILVAVAVVLARLVWQITAALAVLVLSWWST